MTAPIRIVQNAAASRYEAWIEDHLAGVAEYHLEPGRIVFTHTETDESLHGQGVGSRLAVVALDDARAQRLAVTPRCPFIARFIREHPEYEDLVAGPSGGP